MTADEIIDALGGLSGADRNKIRAVLSLLAPGDSESSNGHAPASELVWEAVREVVGPHFPTYGRMKKTRYASRLREGAQIVEGYSVKHMPRLTRTERISTYRHMVRALLIWMDRAELAITPGRVVSSLAMIPQAVDDQFPGYAEAGRLAWALTMIAEGE